MCGQAHAAHRWTHVKPARVTLSFAFCQPVRQAQATQQRKNGNLEGNILMHDQLVAIECAVTHWRHSDSGQAWIPATCFLRKSTKNRSNICEKPSQNSENSRKHHSWAVSGVQRRFGDASGRIWDAPGTRQSRPRVDLGAPWASQEQPGVVPKRLRAGPETHLGRTGALPKRVRHTEHRETRSRNDFATFLRRHAKARSLKFMRPRSVS